MIEIQIINILSLFWKHNTFLAVYCTLVTVIIFKNKKTTKQKNSKTNKQTRQNKKEKKKGRREKEGP